MSAALVEAPIATRPRPAGRIGSPSRELTVHVMHDADGGMTLRASGKLDVYTVTRLRDRMARHDPGAARVRLDISEVTMIDSSGLGTLLSFANRARRGGARLGLICTPHLAEVLRIARVGDAFDPVCVTEAPPR